MKKTDSPEKPQVLNGEWKTTTSVASWESEEFLPLPIKNLVAGEEVPFEVLVRIRMAGKDQLQSCCLPGEKFEPVWLEKLQSAGITRVYFHQQDQPLVLNYLNRRLAQVLDDERLPVKEKAERLTDITHVWVQQFFDNTQTQGTQQMKEGFKYVDHLLQCIPQDHYLRGWLLDLCRHDQSLYSHCLNTSLICMAFAKSLGWEDRKIRELGRGALVHDIGMTRVPPQILTKKEELSEDEKEQIKRHPYSGFVLLKTFSLMSKGALLMVLQHHENGDGSGYPDGLTLAKIHPLAKLLRIVDSFTGLISPRGWRPAYPPAEALWIMRQDWQKSGIYDVGLLAAFIKLIGGEKK